MYRGRTMRGALVAVIAACLVFMTIKEVDATAMTTGRKLGNANQYEISYAIVGNNVDIEVAYRGRAGYFALLFTGLNGGGHEGNAQSILCNIGQGGTAPFAIASRQGVGGKTHIAQNSNLVVLQSAAASAILTKCRFTRPLAAAGDIPQGIGQGALDVVLTHGLSKITTYPGTTALAYNQHAPAGRLNFDVADGQGGTPGQGLAVQPDPVDPGPVDLITEAPAPTIDLEGDPAGVPMEIMIAGGAGGLVALAGLYTVVRKSGAGGGPKRSRGNNSYSGPPPTAPSKPSGFVRGGFSGGKASPMAMGIGMAPPPAEGSPWRAAMDPTTNRVYYFHKYTQETMWTKPPGFSG